MTYFLKAAYLDSFIRSSKTGRIMSWPPFVRPSCLLRNSDTVQDVFMKLGTNVNHYQTMCKEQEPTLYLQFLRNYVPSYENRIRSLTLISSRIIS